ncbi:hypothetical protein ACWT_5721 [Actinoplanes sp. SE50]|uniref:TY-Chap domain-containing protein n=1 Tax=unclassified Actinoplanes TaxID=2626549 RepID=UPI00023ED4B5|nr:MULTISPECIES: hypothetical protein [unclassified Actinoplanes]AEV86739.1 hypothetical protein ACPL_5852 [Actinoplanes sp. SE50/110]ATO85136.1 hypothetical protein ACWT_5721 [Actinoplanes sp. SE50]SLM02547.1 hypothetical protein ACSP50_5797 [Actinoplanes sp. SE50/110]
METTDWGTLTDELVQHMFEMAEGDVLILSYGAHYVQMKQGPRWLSIEAVANEFLPDEVRLDEAGQRRLTELGWAAPDPPASYNWHQDTAFPIRSDEARRLATMMAVTLDEVFRVTHPAELSRDEFNVRTV